MTNPAFGLVELATCPQGSLGGRSTGPFRIAEVGIMMSTAPGQVSFPLGDLNLTMLWLLDAVLPAPVHALTTSTAASATSEVKRRIAGQWAESR